MSVQIVMTASWYDACRELEPQQQQVAFALVDLLRSTPAVLLRDGGLIVSLVGAVRASQPALAAAAGVTRKVVRTTLVALAKAGAIDLAVEDGPSGSIIALHGVTWVRLAPDGVSSLLAELALDDVEKLGQATRELMQRINTRSSGEIAQRGQVPGQVRGQASTVDDTPARGQVRGQVDQAPDRDLSTGDSQAVDAGIVAEMIRRGAPLRDAHDDLLTGVRDARIPDPRSPSAPVADPDPAVTAAASEQPTKKTDSEAKRSGKGASETGSGKRRSVRSMQLAELPAAAVAMADDFRGFVCREQPWHHARKATPWEGHALRLRWAQDFSKLAKAQSDGPLDEPRVYELIRRMLVWLATDQGCSDPRYRVIVLSTDALVEKWDRIAARVAAPVSRASIARPTVATTRKLSTAPTQPTLDLTRHDD